MFGTSRGVPSGEGSLTMVAVTERSRERQTRAAAQMRGMGWTTTVFALVAAALVGLAIGWLAFRDAGVDVPAEVEEVLEGYDDAWNAGDGEAALSYMKSNGVFISRFTGLDGAKGDEFVRMVNAVVPDGIDEEFSSVVGDDPYVVVTEGTAYGEAGYSVFYLSSDTDGVLRIASHRWFQTS